MISIVGLFQLKFPCELIGVMEVPFHLKSHSQDCHKKEDIYDLFHNHIVWRANWSNLTNRLTYSLIVLMKSMTFSPSSIFKLDNFF